MLWILLGVISGLVFFWLFPLKLLSRLAARFGKSAPCPASLAWLVNNPIRRRYMRPVLDRVGIRPGECVLELGPGPGLFTVGAARRVGPTGRLIAVDIQPEMIAQVEQRVREAGLTNVETHVADAYHLPLDDESVDRVFLVTMLPEVPDQTRALAELRRVLKSGGLLSVTEEFTDPDYPFAFETILLVEAVGFSLEQRFGNFWLYTVNFRKGATRNVWITKHMKGRERRERRKNLVRFGSFASFVFQTAPGGQYHIVAYLDDLQAQIDALIALQGATQAELDALSLSVLDRTFREEL